MSEDNEEYVPWGERENFKDIAPILQDDGPEESTVIRIPYTAECTLPSELPPNSINETLPTANKDVRFGTAH